MFTQICVSISVTVSTIFLPLVVMYREDTNPEPSSYFYHLFLFAGVAIIYWSIYLMAYFKQRSEKGEKARHLSDFIWPMTVIVVLNVLLLAFFSYTDNRYRVLFPTVMGWGRFGISIIEVFPETQFPLGVVMYAYWGAFVYNTSSFVQRIIEDDFIPRVVVLGTLRIILAVFASILIYFAFFPEVFQYHEGSKVTANVTSAGFLIVASFLAGLYPRRSIKMVTYWCAGRLSQFLPKMGKYTYTPLTMIQGITLDIEDRLNEEGINSIQAIATSDLKELHTRHLPYPDETLADWIDQARLALYFTDEAEFTAIQGLGIRTYRALCGYQQSVKNDPSILENLDPSPVPKERFRQFVLHGIFPIERFQRADNSI